MAKDKVLEHYHEQLKRDEQVLKDFDAGTREEFEDTPTGRVNITAKTVAKLRHGTAKLRGIISAHEQKSRHG
jgi:hypothetical protein